MQSALKLCSSLDDIFNVIPKRCITSSSTPVNTADTLSFLRKLRAMFPIIPGLRFQFWNITEGVLIRFGNVRSRLSLLITSLSLLFKPILHFQKYRWHDNSRIHSEKFACDLIPRFQHSLSTGTRKILNGRPYQEVQKLSRSLPFKDSFMLPTIVFLQFYKR